MTVYRIGRTRYGDDLSGEGARLYGGRWNHRLTPCLYTSESRALSILEYTVNVNIEDIPRALSLATILIPENSILEVTIKDLPGDWRNSPVPASTKDLGTVLLNKGQFAIIKIPSVIIPSEFNYLLNPLHKFSRQFEIKALEDFVYDVRIKH